MKTGTLIIDDADRVLVVLSKDLAMAEDYTLVKYFVVKRILGTASKSLLCKAIKRLLET